MAEAVVSLEKFTAEADGIDRKAVAMKKLDGVGKEHEEFKLRLNKDKEVELAQINIQKSIADAQAEVISNALKTAKIDIVGGETVFFDKIIGAISNGKSMDRMVGNSQILTKVKTQLLDDPNGATLIDQLRSIFKDSGMQTEDLKNLSITALVTKMMASTNDPIKHGMLQQMLKMAQDTGLGNSTADELGITE
jgi:flotillin